MRVGKRTGLSFRLVRLAAASMMAALPVVLSSCASSGVASGPAATTSNGNVITLNKIDTLKSLFNRDDGHTRLILIFSPT